MHIQGDIRYDLKKKKKRKKQRHIILLMESILKLNRSVFFSSKKQNGTFPLIAHIWKCDICIDYSLSLFYHILSVCEYRFCLIFYTFTSLISKEQLFLRLNVSLCNVRMKNRRSIGVDFHNISISLSLSLSPIIFVKHQSCDRRRKICWAHTRELQCISFLISFFVKWYQAISCQGRFLQLLPLFLLLLPRNIWNNRRAFYVFREKSSTHP